MPKSSGNDCSGEIDEISGYDGFEADLLIMIKMVNSETNYVAYALPCLSNNTNRPVVGVIAINARYLKIG